MHQKIWDRNFKKNKKIRFPKNVPKIPQKSGKIGENRGIIADGNFPWKFPKNWGGDGEDIFWENWGLIGDGDKLFIGEVWGMFPKIPPKSGWGRGKHCWGKLGTNWGRGQTCCRGILGNFPENSPKTRLGTGKAFSGICPTLVQCHHTTIYQ